MRTSLDVLNPPTFLHNTKGNLHIMFVRLGAMLAATAAAQGVADGTCSLQSGCPWDKVDFRCLSGGRGILSVVYQRITHYSGAVACGNLFLEKDIGGGINTPPFVAFEQAQADKFYTLIMIDPARCGSSELYVVSGRCCCWLARSCSPLGGREYRGQCVAKGRPLGCADSQPLPRAFAPMGLTPLRPIPL